SPNLTAVSEPGVEAESGKTENKFPPVPKPAFTLLEFRYSTNCAEAPWVKALNNIVSRRPRCVWSVFIKHEFITGEYSFKKDTGDYHCNKMDSVTFKSHYATKFFIAA